MYLKKTEKFNEIVRFEWNKNAADSRHKAEIQNFSHFNYKAKLYQMARQCQGGHANDPPRTASTGIKLSLSAGERGPLRIIGSPVSDLKGSRAGFMTSPWQFVNGACMNNPPALSVSIVCCRERFHAYKASFDIKTDL